MKTPFWNRKQRDQELNEEIQAHLTLGEREEMESGHSRKDAELAARHEFGNETLARETTRDMWGWRWISDLIQDVRHGVRLMRKNPGFTTIAILTLALGIGANTAIFSLIDTVMLKMLPVQNPGQLMLLAYRSPKSTGDPSPVFTNPLWEEIRDRQDVFSSAFAWSQSGFDLAQGGESRPVNGVFVSGHYFSTLGVQPYAGRLFSSDDDKRGCSGAIVLSYAFWQTHFGGDQSAIGSMLTLSRHPLQIIGIAPPGFFGVDVGDKFDVAVPICSEAFMRGKNTMLDQRAGWWLNIVGRAKPGLSTQQLSSRLQVLSPQIFAATVADVWKPDSQKSFLTNILVASPAGKGVSDVRSAYEQPLRMLMAVVGLVLLIACANIASLILARAATRQKEISIRLAVGASRSRLIRQLLTECVLLSFSGAALGVLLARWGCGILVRLISSPQNPVFLEFAIDARMLAFTAGMAVLTGLLFGLLPALRSTRISLASTMRGTRNESSGRAQHRPGRWIVASQVTLSLVLLIVAGLFLRSFNNLLTLDTGFDRSNVLLVNANSRNANVSPEQRPVLWQQTLQRLQALPGVISASESIITPISGAGANNFFLLQSGAGPTGRDALAFMNYVSPDYFATLRSPIRTGRSFDVRDVTGAPLVGIVNETMARKFFGNVDPIGQYLHEEASPGNPTPPIQVIGILKDAKYRSLREATRPTIYFPIAQLSGTRADRMTETPAFELRTAGNPLSLSRSAEEAIAGLNKSVSINFRTLEEQVDNSLKQDQLLATLSGFFGGLALLLAMIGLYGVLAYMVTQRRKEIGIRMALGAGKSSILRLILRDVSILLTVGIAAGVGISLWATRFLQKMLFNLGARDVKTILFSVAILSVVALMAGYLPARRAARLDPNAILRDE